MRLRFLILFVFTVTHSFAQFGKSIPIGSWRMHASFANALAIEKMEDKLFVATSSGIFSYHLADGSIEVLSKIEGLSDVGISSMKKHPTRNLIAIGYENGNIDLFENNKITNVNDIFTGNIIGSKRINSIRMSGSLAYISTNFGIVVINLQKREVKESNTAMGINETTIQVRDCIQFKDTIYAITAEGLKSISIKGQFRNNRQWRNYRNLPSLPTNPADFFTLDSLERNLILSTWYGLHINYPSAPFKLEFLVYDVKRSVSYFNGQYIFCTKDNVIEINASDFKGIDTLDGIYYKKISRPSAAFYAEDTKFIADLDNGLLKIKGLDTTRILPNGPIFNTSFSLTSYNDEVVLHSGGYSFPAAGQESKISGGFAIFKDNNWTTYDPFFDPKLPRVQDYVRSYYNPSDKKLYLASFGYGIIVKDQDRFSIMNDFTTGGGLCNFSYQRETCIHDFTRAYQYIKVGGCSFDKVGNLWAGNYEIDAGSLRVLRAGEDYTKRSSWDVIKLPSSNQLFPLDIMVDQNNFKWIRMAPNSESGNAAIWIIGNDITKRVKLTTGEKTGGLPSNNIYDIKEDKSGYVWVGTEKGLAVFYNPINAFAPGGLTASTPIFPPEAGRPVLENDVVTSIEVDGANRKWVGTKDNGIWLFNADITKLISHFTTKNSPLLSNLIYDIALNKASGELFIATDKGCISYQTDANETLDENGEPVTKDCSNQNISLFPNPVKKGYDGLIAVSGLASNSTVKFVTASGKLVYETTSKGGLATWDGFTYDKQRVNPGIYMIIATTPEGEKSCFSKLAILD